MRPVFRNALIALLLLGFAAFIVIPPEKNLRLGKDLRGGVSLVYAVQLDPGDNAGEVLGQTIDVLKRRVDPNGVLEIAMVAQGRDRIEITMPLPGEDVKQLRSEFESQLTSLGQASIEPDALERVLRLDGLERSDALDELAGGSDERRAMLQGLADAYDTGRRLRVELDEAQADGIDAEQLDLLIGEIAGAEIRYEELRAEALASALSPEAVRRALELDDQPKRIFDRETGDTLELPSPRRRAIDSIRERYPELSSQLDEVIASWATYNAERRTLDDPSDLKRLLRGAGVLTFRISVNVDELPEEDSLRRQLQEEGPQLAGTESAKWYRLNKADSWFNDAGEMRAMFDNPSAFFSGRGYVVEEYNGEFWMLCWDERGLRLTPAEGDRWQVSRAFQTVDEVGRPAIGFNMNTAGGQLLGQLTENNVQRQMAVLLDDQVYTAPTLQSRIATQGRITGDFSPEEVRYIIRTLAAGSLQAKLSPQPIAEFQVAPDLGIDNLRSGLRAGLWALAAVSVFMVIYYFFYGGVSVFALCCNALLILGAMAANKSAFTLPGIAGIILTFGMAVDANVLIYERIREELRKGIELRIAVRLGFQKALSSIVDGNVTNLIVCLVLANFGTQEIKGFAITLGIGVIGTLISALLVSRVIFQILVDEVKVRGLSMLPMAMPAIERVLEPKIQWLRFRPVFIVISTVFVAIGVLMIVKQNVKMLDNEFRGGTQITVQLERDDATGERRIEERSVVEDLVHSAADAEGVDERVLSIRNAEVIAVDPDASGTRSDRFTIKTTLTDQSLVEDTVLGALSDLIESLPPIQFFGREAEIVRDAPAYRVITGVLGDDTDRPRFRDDVSSFRGGLVIMLERMEPAPSIEGIRERLDTLRSQPDYASGSGRQVEVRLLEGSPEAVETAAVLVRDPSLTFFDDDELWQSTVLAQEWSLAREALGRATAPAQLQRFSPVIAENFRAQAVVAVGLSFLLITIYIWVRFGSMRYSLAAIVTLLHDVLIAIGLIALAEIVYDFEATADVARSIGVLPFKINLTLVAAMLTIIGYSLNDTIIIMDRIRENRGKLPYATSDVVNLSINQTISRTVITSGTTMVATLILFIFGGEGVRAFSYALLIGVVVGTYSSIAVAAPLVWSRKHSARFEQPKTP
ncbi:MAG: protein translocase subunit SecD [Planctomycetota bacterium]